MAIVTGIANSLNVMYVDLIETFSTTRAKAATVQSCVIGGLGMSGIFTGPCVSWLGLRRAGLIGVFISSMALALSFFADSIMYLAVVLGIGTGVGSSFPFIAAQSAVGKYFDKKSSPIAMSLIMTGGGVGGVVLPYLISYLTTEYGIKGALLICGGIEANCLAAFLLVHPDNRTPRQLDDKFTDTNITEMEPLNKQQSSEEKNRQEFQCFVWLHRRVPILFIKRDAILLFKNIPLMCVSLGLSISLIAFYVVFFIMMDHLKLLGYSDSNGVLIITVTNSVNTVSRLLPGALKQIPNLGILYIPIMMTVIGGFCVLAMPFVSDITTLAVLYSLSCGLPFGCQNSVKPLCLMKLVDERLFPVVIGASLTVLGVGVVVSGPITGYIEDMSGSYNLAFYISGGTLLACSTLLTVGLVLHRNENDASCH
ncbi:hypothetical protein ScPMuIL_011900 [Solemya velum]